MTEPSVQEFLSVFRREGEPVSLRLFPPKGAQGSAQKLDVPLDKFPIARLQQENKTRGIYFVVCSGGQRDREISRYVAAFCESDDKSIEEQHAALNAGPLPPSIEVETRKSVHAYWLLPVDNSTTEDEWRQIHAGLIAYFKSDPSIKNPSHTMRLPGFNHLKRTDDGGLEYTPVRCVKFNPELRYSAAQLLEAFPAPAIEHSKALVSSNGHYSTWDELNGELRRRMLNDPSTTIRGQWAHTRGICHNGQGNSALSLNLASNAYKCANGCTPEQILPAFGLPTRPDKQNAKTKKATKAATKASSRGRSKTEDGPLVERTGFKRLNDGRVIEQISTSDQIGARFIIYDPATDKVSYAAQVEFDGVIYTPHTPDRAMKFPTEAAEYGTESELDALIEDYLHRHVDIRDRDRKVTAQYTKLSHIANRLQEINYLRVVAESGGGKSRFMHVATNICHRPRLTVTPSAPSIFRNLDQFGCTFGNDEFNPKDGGDDTSEIIRIYNAGYTADSFVTRMEKGPGGEMISRSFNVFGPKIISSLKPLDSQAFESRCVPIEMMETKRMDIKFRISSALLKEQAELRNKLLLWRLRNLNKDFEPSLDAAEAFLRTFPIKPRHVEIGTPLVALIQDSALKHEFARSLETRTVADREERRESVDGQIATAIHNRLFGKRENGELFIKGDPTENEPHYLLPLEEIVSALNEGLAESRKHDPRWVGKQLRKLGLKTQKNNEREDDKRDKRFVVYNLPALQRLFSSFSLLVPPDFNVANVANAVNEASTQDIWRYGGNSEKLNVSGLTAGERGLYTAGDNGDKRILESEADFADFLVRDAVGCGECAGPAPSLVSQHERHLLHTGGYADGDIRLFLTREVAEEMIADCVQGLQRRAAEGRLICSSPVL